MREITLRIKNDRLAESIIAILKEIKEIAIFETKKEERPHKQSKIFQILENPYDVENFRIYKRDEIF